MTTLLFFLQKRDENTKTPVNRRIITDVFKVVAKKTVSERGQSTGG